MYGLRGLEWTRLVNVALEENRLDRGKGVSINLRKKKGPDSFRPLLSVQAARRDLYLYGRCEDRIGYSVFRFHMDPIDMNMRLVDEACGPRSNLACYL